MTWPASVPQEVVDLVLRDVIRMHTEVQPESMPVVAVGQAANYRDSVAPVVDSSDVLECALPATTCVERLESS